MQILPIRVGVSQLTDKGQVFANNPYEISKEEKEQIHVRDEHTCRYCGFESERYQEVLYTGNGKNQKFNPDDYATACVFCQQCAQIDKVSFMQSGAVIWLPEIGQAALNHICRAIYIARITQGPIAEAARDALDVLLMRKEEAEHRLGTSDVSVLASVLQDFLEAKEYHQRSEKLKGFRILPLDRRIVQEGDLEFNQFPQILAYWRSQEGPFGPVPPREWKNIFFEAKQALAEKS